MYCVGRRSRELGLGKELMFHQEIDELGLGKELMAHQEIEELGSLKLGLGLEVWWPF